MGEFSYGQDLDFSAGYEGGDPSQQAFGYAGYQQEAQSLVPDGVPMLAAILMEQGVLPAESIQAILARQQESGDTLAQILLDDGYAASDQLVTALQQRAAYR
jgi:hypothetical protein